MISGIDHIALIVNDLEKSVADYRLLLGRAPNWRGTLEGARHAWFQLPNLALDVISPADEGRFGSRARERLESAGEGIWAIGLAVADIEAATRTAERRGLRVAERMELTSVGEGGETRQWLCSNFAREPTAGIPLFLVQSPVSAWPLSQCTNGEDAAVTGLDHVVIRTRNVDRAAALFGARLGLDLRLDRASEQAGARLLFFRCGDLVFEIAAPVGEPPAPEPDSLGGLAWRLSQAADVRARLASAGFNLSELRKGRKPGTRVFTVRDRTANIPTLMLESEPPPPH